MLPGVYIEAAPGRGMDGGAADGAGQGGRGGRDLEAARLSHGLAYYQCVCAMCHLDGDEGRDTGFSFPFERRKKTVAIVKGRRRRREKRDYKNQSRDAWKKKNTAREKKGRAGGREDLNTAVKIITGNRERLSSLGSQHRSLLTWCCLPPASAQRMPDRLTSAFATQR